MKIFNKPLNDLMIVSGLNPNIGFNPIGYTINMFGFWNRIQESFAQHLSVYQLFRTEVYQLIYKLYDFAPKQEHSFKPIENATFTKMVGIFSYEYLKCFIHINQFKDNPDLFTKKLYGSLISTSHLLEDFLDIHGAKNNRKWYYYRELTATIRHLCLAGYSQKHIANRLSSYMLDNPKQFEKEGLDTHYFLVSLIKKFASVILNEAKRLDLLIPENIEWQFYPKLATGEQLEFDMIEDLNEEHRSHQQKNILKIASEFIKISKQFESHAFFQPYTDDELKHIVPAKINEVEIRKCEMVVHNLQSYFDSYIIIPKNGAIKLAKLRGYISVVLHLLKMMGRLLHYYERHLMCDEESRNETQEIRNRFAAIINPTMLLDRTINFGLFYVCHFLNDGQKLAKEVLNENIERSHIVVGVPVKQGFHMRPSMLVAKIVEHFGGQVELCIGENRFDASSVLDIQWAGGKIQKENISEVTFEGDSRALADIQLLAGINYGEDSIGKGIPLPKELGYLK